MLAIHPGPKDQITHSSSSSSSNNDEKSTPGNTKQNIAKRDGSAEELDRETGEEQTTVGRTQL